MRLAAEGAIVTVVIISRAPLTHVCMLMQTRGGCFQLWYLNNSTINKSRQKYIVTIVSVTIREEL